MKHIAFFFLIFLLVAKATAGLSSASVPNTVVQALAGGDTLLAASSFPATMSDEKSKYLFHEISHTIQDGEPIKNRRNKDNQENAYQSIRRRGIAYHNIYLFLRTQGIEEKNYLKKARTYYQHAVRLGSELERAKCQVLLATLFALDGDERKADKQFAVVNSQLLSADAEIVSFVAAFWASRENIEETLVALEYAHALAPKPIAKWIEQGDDFWLVKSDENFLQLLNNWQQGERDTRHQLPLPHNDTLAFDLPELGGQYRFSQETRAKKKSGVFKKLYPSY